MHFLGKKNLEELINKVAYYFAPQPIQVNIDSKPFLSFTIPAYNGPDEGFYGSMVGVMAGLASQYRNIPYFQLSATTSNIGWNNGRYRKGGQLL